MNPRYKYGAIAALAFASSLVGSAYAGEAAKGNPQDDQPPGSNGAQVAVDKNGKLRAPTPEESTALQQQMSRYVDQSSVGLSVSMHWTGALYVDLQDRFQDVAIAKAENGQVELACVDSLAQSKAFLDPGTTVAASRTAPMGIRPTGTLEEK